MEEAERYVRTWVASPRDKEIEDTISGVANGQFKLVHVVKALGEYLTSEEGDLRNKGVEFLALVVSKCPPENFNLQSIKVLIAFFASKLEDTETIIPALKGLLAVVRIPVLIPENITDICTAIFANVKMQALVQVQRHTSTVLKSMGEQFLSGYIALADGEKDPRNLMVAFAIARVLALEFDISTKFEDLAPANDPYGITQRTSRALFARYPSNLAHCLPVYGSNVAANSARKLWSSLKLEIFQPTDIETEGEALKTTQVLIKTIYADEVTDTDLDGLAKDACAECVQILKQPEKSQAKPAIKVLCAFMSTTPSVSRYTLSHVVPHLTRLFVDPDELPNRGPVLSLLSSLIAAARDSTDEVLGAQSSLRPAIEGLNGMEIGFVVQKVNDVITSQQEDLLGTRDAALDLLKTISSKTPSHIAQMTLPLLFSALPDQAPGREDAEGREKYRMGLSALSHLCAQPNLFETLVVRLSVRLGLLYSPATVPEDTEPSAAYAHALLSTLADVLARKVENGDLDVPKYVDRLVPRLFNLFVHGALVTTGITEMADPRIIDVVARLLNLVTQSLSAQRQETFAEALFAAYFKGNVTPLAVGDLSLPEDAHFMPFDPAAPESQANLVSLFSECVIAFYPEVKIPMTDEGTVLVELLNWGIRYAKTRGQQECACHIVAAIVNKHSAGLDTFLKSTFTTFWDEEIANPPNRDSRRRAISAWAWISRALLVRNHPEALPFVNRLFELFDDTEVGWDAARAIGQAGTVDKVLTKRNHAVVKILHAQKYASSILPKIIQGMSNPTQQSRQTTYLVALAALIKVIPRAAYAHELPTLMPLLLRGLSLPDPMLRAGVINTLLSAAQVDLEAGSKTAKEGSVVSEHANSAVSEMPDMRVRIGALKYLAVLPKIVRYDVLHPQKAMVLRELTKALDDPKRAVRKEAVDARTSWFTYSG
ncbi:ARM repeat-containing protein [Russula vinacea]|nr:ARM repeat-containing protein [Russula vinacea]